MNNKDNKLKRRTKMGYSLSYMLGVLKGSRNGFG
jgi:hypothetical protein